MNQVGKYLNSLTITLCEALTLVCDALTEAKLTPESRHELNRKLQRVSRLKQGLAINLKWPNQVTEFGTWREICGSSLQCIEGLCTKLNSCADQLAEDNFSDEQIEIMAPLWVLDQFESKEQPFTDREYREVTMQLILDAQEFYKQYRGKPGRPSNVSSPEPEAKPIPEQPVTPASSESTDQVECVVSAPPKPRRDHFAKRRK